MKRAILLPLLGALLLSCGGDADDTPAGTASAGAESSAVPPAFEVYVQNPDGSPVAGATVLVRIPAGAGPAGRRGRQFSTGDEGRARIRIEETFGIERDAALNLAVAAPGHVPASWDIPGYRPGIGQRVTATLDPAGSVTGRIVDERGLPVPDAFVYLVRPDVPGFVSEDEAFGTRTGSDGSYRIDPAPPGRLDLGVRAKGFVPAVRTEISVAAHSTTAVDDLVLAPGLEISGRVETPDGEPVATARVRAWRNEDLKEANYYGRSGVVDSGGVAQTNEEGTFTIDGLPPASYTVDASAPGYETVNASRPEVAAGTADIVLVLARGFELTVHVVDAATKRPVGKFRLLAAEHEALMDPAGRPLGVDDRSVTSPLGATTLSLRRGAVYRIEVEAEGYRLGGATLGPVGEETGRSITIELPPR